LCGASELSVKKLAHGIKRLATPWVDFSFINKMC